MIDLKENLKKLRKKVVMLGIATSLAFSTSGCSKEEEKIGYLVENDDNIMNSDGLYQYVVDYNGLESNNYNFSIGYNNISFAKVIEEKEYGTSFFNEMTSAFYRKHLKVIWPDCFSLYNLDAWLKESNFDFDLKVENIKLLNGPTFKVFYSSITAKRKLNLIGKDVISNGKREFLSGDNISSIAIYYESELVAFKQYGVGSDCENVVSQTIGDVDVAFVKISELGLLNETQNISLEKLKEYQEELNDEKSLKRKK